MCPTITGATPYHLHICSTDHARVASNCASSGFMVIWSRLQPPSTNGILPLLIEPVNFSIHSEPNRSRCVSDRKCSLQHHAWAHAVAEEAARALFRGDRDPQRLARLGDRRHADAAIEREAADVEYLFFGEVLAPLTIGVSVGQRSVFLGLDGNPVG